MGNGPGLGFKGYGEILSDMTEQITKTTGLEDIANGSVLEALMESAAKSFGQPNQIFMSPQSFNSYAGHFGGSMAWNPEFDGTGWDKKWRLTKRERKFAQVQTFLKKLRVLPNDEAFNTEIKDTAVKRLKRAKWARYQQAKKV